jgi:hypothetical protein
MSQNSHKPIFELKANNGVVGAHFTKVRESKEIFRHIAVRLEDNVERLVPETAIQQ